MRGMPPPDFLFGGGIAGRMLQGDWEVCRMAEELDKDGADGVPSLDRLLDTRNLNVRDVGNLLYARFGQEATEAHLLDMDEGPSRFGAAVEALRKGRGVSEKQLAQAVSNVERILVRGQKPKRKQQVQAVSNVEREQTPEQRQACSVPWIRKLAKGEVSSVDKTRAISLAIVLGEDELQAHLLMDRAGFHGGWDAFLVKTALPGDLSERLFILRDVAIPRLATPRLRGRPTLNELYEAQEELEVLNESMEAQRRELARQIQSRQAPPDLTPLPHEMNRSSSDAKGMGLMSHRNMEDDREYRLM
jgi:hypothetical protein